MEGDSLSLFRFLFSFYPFLLFHACRVSAISLSTIIIPVSISLARSKIERFSIVYLSESFSSYVTNLWEPSPNTNNISSKIVRPRFPRSKPRAIDPIDNDSNGDNNNGVELCEIEYYDYYQPLCADVYTRIDPTHLTELDIRAPVRKLCGARFPDEPVVGNAGWVSVSTLRSSFALVSWAPGCPSSCPHQPGQRPAGPLPLIPASCWPPWGSHGLRDVVVDNPAPHHFRPFYCAAR